MVETVGKQQLHVGENLLKTQGHGQFTAVMDPTFTEPLHPMWPPGVIWPWGEIKTLKSCTFSCRKASVTIIVRNQATVTSSWHHFHRGLTTVSSLFLASRYQMGFSATWPWLVCRQGRELNTDWIACDCSLSPLLWLVNAVDLDQPLMWECVHSQNTSKLIHWNDCRGLDGIPASHYLHCHLL